MNKPIKKIVESTGDLCVKFTDEEMASLGIKPGDKFSYHPEGDGLVLKKYATLDIELNELSREVLEMLVQMSCEKDVSINEIIEEIVQEFIEHNENAA